MAEIGRVRFVQQATPERPWLGLRSYTRESADYFYGRDQEVDELYRRVRLEPLTLLYGKSGLGKTSLLGAGLQPRLQVEGWRPVLMRLHFELDAPTLIVQVRRELGAAIGINQPASDDTELWRQCFEPELSVRVELIRPVLIFDQFEEAFTLVQEVRDGKGLVTRRDRRAELAELMAELAAVIERRLPDHVPAPEYDLKVSSLRVLISQRNDYLHELERWKKLLPGLMRNRVELRELRGPDAILVVLEPAKKGPRPLVTSDVARRMVCFVAGRDVDTALDDIDAVPPLLSLLCAELNEVRLDQGALEISVEHFGSEADRVLERFYKRSLDGMPSGVGRAIEELLIDSSGRIREASSSATVVDEMLRFGVDDPESHVHTLIQGRLLTIEERGGVPRLELTHDLLVPLVARERERREAEERAKQLEARQAVELEALKARQREEMDRLRFVAMEADARTARAKQRRSLWIATAMFVLAIVAILSLIDASTSRREAEAIVEQAAARAQGRAVERLEQGDYSAYAAYLAESLGYTPTVASERAALVPQQFNWPMPRWVVEHDRLKSIVVSLDGMTLATVASDGTIQLWNGEQGTAIGSPIGDVSWEVQPIFSPDGKTLLYVTKVGAVARWGISHGRALQGGFLDAGRVTSLEFSPDGEKALTASEDGTVNIWDAATGSRIGSPMRHPGMVSVAVFSQDGSRVLTASTDNAVRTWDANSGEEHEAPVRRESSSEGMRPEVNGGSYFPLMKGGRRSIWDGGNGQHQIPPSALLSSFEFATLDPRGGLLTGSTNESLVYWESAYEFGQGTVIQSDDLPKIAEFSSDGLRLATVSSDDTLHIFDMSSLESSETSVHVQTGTFAAAFAARNRNVVTASADGTVVSWDLGGATVERTIMRHDSAVRALAFDQTGKVLATGSSDGLVSVWNADNGTPKLPSMNHDDSVGSVAFSDDGKRLLTAGEDGTARLWDLSDARQVGQPMAHAHNVRLAEFSPDQKVVVTVSDDGFAYFRDLNTGRQLGQPMQHDGMVFSADFNEDGSRLLTASFDGGVRVWFVPSGRNVFAIPNTDNPAYCAAYSPDDRTIAACYEDGTVRLLDSLTGLVLSEITGYEAPVSALAFSPDGSKLIAADWHGNGRLWDLATLRNVGPAMGNDGPVSWTGFSPDGSQIATSSSGHTARLWDAETALPIGPAMRHQDSITQGQFSRDGKQLATAGEDGTVRIWNTRGSAALESPVTGADLMALSGRQVAESGQLAWIEPTEWLARIEAVRKRSEAGRTDKDRLISWQLSDRTSRTISAFSELYTADEIERTIDWALKNDQPLRSFDEDALNGALGEAYNRDPGHPLILLALSVLESNDATRSLWIRLSFPRFANHPEIAARAAEILLLAKDWTSARRAAEIVLSASTSSESDRARAESVLSKLERLGGDSSIHRDSRD